MSDILLDQQRHIQGFEILLFQIADARSGDEQIDA
jgi:hypothetical protein